MAHNFRECDVIRNIGAVPELELYPSLSVVGSVNVTMADHNPPSDVWLIWHAYMLYPS